VHGRPSDPRDELVAAVYAAAAGLVPSSRPLELLSELTRSDKSFAAHFNFDRQRGKILASFNVEPHNVETYQEIYASQNPWLARASYFQAEGLVWRGSEIVDLARLKETEFYKLFLYGQVIENTAHVVVRVRGADVFHVMLTRRRDAEDYDDGALEICRLFAFHARQAFEITDASAARQFIEEACNTAIDELAAGVAVIEPPTTILYLNQTFAALIDGFRGAGTPQSPRSTILPPFARRHPTDTKLPRPLVDALSAHPVPKSCVVHATVDDGTRPIAIEIRPVQLRSLPGALARNGFILLSRSPDCEIEVDEPALRTAYSLTPAEARVCAALVSGENIHILSDKLSISPQTARTHLKRIYDKTSTTRQPELVRLLMSFAYRKPAKPPALPARRPSVTNVLPPWLTRDSANDD
jgi:DNA-binding CsgD family transcriptional regulator